MPIRTATESDIDAIERVARQSWTADYPDILTRETAEQAANEWYDDERLASELADDRTLLLVAETDGSVVGFTHATWNDEEGYILRTYVDPDHRGEGFGRRLLEAAQQGLRERGVGQINAMVLAENDPGNEFYERFGFELADESETTIGGEAYRENRFVLTE